MSWFNDFVSDILPHDGYNSVGDAAKAFFMPGAYAADKTNESNRQLAAEQNETNWNRYLYDNAFNSPVQQMQRMRAAGLNPAMMYEGGGSIATSTPPPNAVENRDVAPDMSGMPTMQAVMQFATNLQMQKAQIANINANTEKTKEETTERQLSNDIGKMNATAFKSAYEEGLVHSALKAGFGKQIDDYRGNRYTLFESAWNFAILTGCTLADSLRSSDTLQQGTYDEYDNYLLDFNFDSKSFKRANALYIGGTEAQIEANKAAKMVAEYQQQHKKKDLDIMKWLNDKSRSDKWYESVPATIGLIGLWLAEQRFSLPSFNLSINSGKKSVGKGFHSND